MLAARLDSVSIADLVRQLMKSGFFFLSFFLFSSSSFLLLASLSIVNVQCQCIPQIFYHVNGTPQVKKGNVRAQSCDEDRVGGDNKPMDLMTITTCAVRQVHLRLELEWVD